MSSATVTGSSSMAQIAAAEARRRALQVAKTFAEAAASGDVDSFLLAVDDLDLCENGWAPAMRRVAQLDGVSDDIRTAFAAVWALHRTLPAEVGNRPVLARALHVLMPAYVHAGQLQIFRGVGADERRRRLYGFSWTTDIEAARREAEHWRESAGAGIVLETKAPADAVIWMWTADEHGVSEVVVDPFKLEAVSVAAGAVIDS